MHTVQIDRIWGTSNDHIRIIIVHINILIGLEFTNFGFVVFF